MTTMSSQRVFRVEIVYADTILVRANSERDAWDKATEIIHADPEAFTPGVEVHSEVEPTDQVNLELDDFDYISNDFEDDTPLTTIQRFVNEY